MDSEVDDMMDQLSAAERELAKKKAEADHDMMMASMVGARLGPALLARARASWKCANVCCASGI